MHLREKLYPKYDPNPTYSPKLLLMKAMKRFNECESKKNPSLIKSEIQIYKKFWKCYPYDYFLCDLYREDNAITSNELINYIPGFFWYYLYLPHHTSYNFGMIIDNKIITEQFFRSLNISQPETLCRILNGRLYSPEMELYSFDQMQNALNQEHYEKLFVKPAEGWGSKGIFIFHKTDSGLYITGQNLIFNENFLANISGKHDYIIQPGIDQDRVLSSVYPNSVNTCRVVTENMGGVARTVCAMLRMGCGQNDVDNVSAGGLCVGIDITTGKVGDFAMSYENEKFSRHPDTNFEFRNFTIPRWDEIRRFTSESAAKLPFFTHLGWDIALTINGPKAVEANLGLGIEALQISQGGLREAFGIENPDFYWKNKGRRS
jgi:hypothetical protein